MVTPDARDGLHVRVVLFQNFFVAFGGRGDVVHFLVPTETGQQCFINVAKIFFSVRLIYTLSFNT